MGHFRFEYRNIRINYIIRKNDKASISLALKTYFAEEVFDHDNTFHIIYNKYILLKATLYSINKYLNFESLYIFQLS